VGIVIGGSAISSLRNRIRAILRLTANGSTRVIGLLSPPTVAAVVGVALTAYGLFMLYEPLAFIVPGVFLTTFGLWLAGMFSKV
jgi:hypothetical protein